MYTMRICSSQHRCAYIKSEAFKDGSMGGQRNRTYERSWQLQSTTKIWTTCACMLSTTHRKWSTVSKNKSEKEETIKTELDGQIVWMSYCVTPWASQFFFLYKRKTCRIFFCYCPEPTAKNYRKIHRHPKIVNFRPCVTAWTFLTCAMLECKCIRCVQEIKYLTWWHLLNADRMLFDFCDGLNISVHLEITNE